jgi:hypothetical protein
MSHLVEYFTPNDTNEFGIRLGKRLGLYNILELEVRLRSLFVQMGIPLFQRKNSWTLW